MKKIFQLGLLCMSALALSLTLAAADGKCGSSEKGMMTPSSKCDSSKKGMKHNEDHCKEGKCYSGKKGMKNHKYR